MFSRLRRFAALNVDQLDLQSFLKKSSAGISDLDHVVTNQLNKFCSANNPAFVDIIKNTYMLLALRSSDSLVDNLKETCINIVTLPYLFDKNKLSEADQLALFNAILYQLNDNIKQVSSLNYPIILDLKRYLIRTFNIEDIVTSIVNTIQSDNFDFSDAMSELFETDEDIQERITDEANKALEQNNISLQDTVNNILDMFTMDEAIISSVSDAIHPEDIQTNTTIQHNPLPGVVNYYSIIDAIKTKLAKSIRNVGNDTYDISNATFAEVLKIYDNNYLNQAIQFIISSLFYPENTKNPLENKKIYTAIFKDIKKNNTPSDDADIIKSFQAIANRGSDLLKLIINNIADPLAEYARILKRFLYILNQDVADNIVFEPKSKLVDTFVKYIKNNYWNPYYTDTVQGLINAFNNENNIVQLYHETVDNKQKATEDTLSATQQQSDDKTSANDLPDNNLSDDVSDKSDIQPDETFLPEHEIPADVENQDDDEAEYRIDSKKSENQLSGNIGALDIDSLISLSNEEQVHKVISNVIQSLFDESNINSLIEYICAEFIKFYHNYGQAIKLQGTLETISKEQLIAAVTTFLCGDMLEYVVRTNQHVFTAQNLSAIVQKLNSKFGNKFKVQPNTSGDFILQDTLKQYILDEYNTYESVIINAFTTNIQDIDIMKIYHSVLANANDKSPDTDGSSINESADSNIAENDANSDDEYTEEELPPVLDDNNTNADNNSSTAQDISDISLEVLLKLHKPIKISQLEAAATNFINQIIKLKKSDVRPLIEFICITIINKSSNDYATDKEIRNAIKNFSAEAIMIYLCTRAPVKSYITFVHNLNIIDEIIINPKSKLIQSINQYIITRKDIYTDIVSQKLATISKNYPIMDIYEEVYNELSSQEDNDNQDNSSEDSQNDQDITDSDDASNSDDRNNNDADKNHVNKDISHEYSSNKISQPNDNLTIHDIHNEHDEKKSITPTTVDTATSPSERTINQAPSPATDSANKPNTPKETRLRRKDTSDGSIICDDLSLNDFLNIVNKTYNISSSKLMSDLVSYAIYAFNELNIINIKSANLPIDQICNIFKNKEVLKIIIRNLLNAFSDIKLSVSNLNTPFVTEIAQRVQADKRFINYLRTSINNLKNVQSPQQDDTPAPVLKHPKADPNARDLSLEETKRLKRVNEAINNDDQVRDKVYFNIADFAYNPKIVILRNDVLIGDAGDDYTTILRTYVEDNPDEPIPQAYATGIISNNCVFVTSYGKLDKNEVISSIKTYCPECQKIYFKEGSRNFTMMTERLAKRII